MPFRPLGRRLCANPTERLAHEKSQCGKPHWLFGDRELVRYYWFYGVAIAVNDAVTPVLLPVGMKVKVQVLEEPDVAEKVPTTAAA